MRENYLTKCLEDIKKLLSVMVWSAGLVSMLTGCGLIHESTVDTKSESVSFEDYTNWTGDYYKYSGKMEDFLGQDLDADGKEDELYRIYKEDIGTDGDSSTVEYELRFGNGEMLSFPKSRDTLGYWVQVEGMDLTGDGRNEIVVMNQHGMSTNPQGEASMRVYTSSEAGYLVLGLPDSTTGKRTILDEENESRRGIPIQMEYREKDFSVLCTNQDFGYEETVNISRDVILRSDAKTLYGELNGDILSESIYQYEKISKDGKTMLRVVQQSGFKGLTGDISYLIEWNKEGEYSISDITYEPQFYDFGQYEIQEAATVHNNLNLDEDGKPDSAVMQNAEDWKKNQYVEIAFGNGEKLIVESEEDAKFQNVFKIMAVDSDSDGEKEIFLLLDRGNQGGEGEYLLRGYDKAENGYVEIKLPEKYGYPYQFSMKENKAVIHCEKLDFKEELVLKEESKAEDSSGSMADGFSDFSFERNDNTFYGSGEEKKPSIYLELKQYMPGNGHADLFCHIITKVAFVDGEYKVIGSEYAIPFDSLYVENQ